MSKGTVDVVVWLYRVRRCVIALRLADILDALHVSGDFSNRHATLSSSSSTSLSNRDLSSLC
jgi:hypothetical protein